MNEDHKKSIDILRSLLSNELNFKLYDDENGFNLMRCLNHFGTDMEKTVPQIKEILELRRILKLDLLDGSIENGEFRKDFHPALTDYFPGGIGGIDKHGNVVYIQPVGFSSPKMCAPYFPCSEFIKWRLFETERIFRLILKQEKISKKKCGHIIIFDFHGLSMDHFYLPALQVYATKISVLQQIYPDTIVGAYFINAPAIFNIFYKFMSPFVSRVLLSKTYLLPSDEKKWKSKLLEMIDPENLPVHWGGTKTGRFGDYGDIVMGGPLPPNFGSPQHPVYPETQLHEIVVSRRQVKCIPFKVEADTTKVTWYFKCSFGGIGFGIRRVDKTNGHEEPKGWIVPKFFLHADHVPEYGSCDLNNGHYQLVFDNSSSWLRSRSISYALDIVV